MNNNEMTALKRNLTSTLLFDDINNLRYNIVLNEGLDTPKILRYSKVITEMAWSEVTTALLIDL